MIQGIFLNEGILGLLGEAEERALRAMNGPREDVEGSAVDDAALAETIKTL